MSSIAGRLSVDADTRERLLHAAAAEFNSLGYFGTNSNKIAKVAGFAPQTFYRHFESKLSAFVAVYEFWQALERDAIARAEKSTSPDRSIAKAVLQHHSEWKMFRRSLRLLAVEEPEVRTARNQSRKSQIDFLARIPANAKRSRPQLIADLLAIERLCDAAADEELAELGVTPSETLQAVTRCVAAARGARLGRLQ